MAEVVIVPDATVAGALIADEIARVVDADARAVIGLATGSTPLHVYRALRTRLAGRDLSGLSGFALDEYLGIDPEHPQSYHAVIRAEVIEPLGLDPARIHVPSGSLEHSQHAGEEYEAAIAAAGGIDLQLLGIGTDGHIGFNEHGSSFASRTRVKALTQQTRQDNARFFDSIDEVPTHAITQGLGTILEARHLVLLAFGEGKARAVAAAVEGPLTAMCPASVIQLHPHVTVVVDEGAASQLQLADYYRHAYANKPSWQGL